MAGVDVSPRPLDPEDIRDEQPPAADVEPVGFTRADSHAATVERAAVIVDEVGSGPALPCSAPRPLPYSRPRYGWSCDPDGPACARAPIPRRMLRPDLLWDSAESVVARALTSADLAAWPFPVFRARPLRGYVGRRNVEPPPLRQVGAVGDLAAALASLADAPRWVDPLVRLEKVRELVEGSAGLTRRALRDALGAA